MQNIAEEYAGGFGAVLASRDGDPHVAAANATECVVVGSVNGLGVIQR